MATEFEIVLDRLTKLASQHECERTARLALENEIAQYRNQPTPPHPRDVIAMLEAMTGDGLIEAIKGCRMLTGLGLKEAKDLICAVRDRKAA